MTCNNSVPLLRAPPGHRLDVRVKRLKPISLAAATLISLSAVGPAWPALGQDANRLELCSLDSETVEELQADVAAGTGIAAGDVEIAFVVVYSLNNDNNGQPLDGTATGPVLCANEAVTGLPAETTADTQIPSGEEDTFDIRDSSEAFLLRYEPSGTPNAETRFCHTTNANVDCYLLGPPVLGE
jgi:hypothetical protein